MSSFKKTSRVFINSWSISSLLEEPFINHHRLQVFALKGVFCKFCNKEGVIVKESLHKDGSKHIDLYCEDGMMMTVDHIMPRSKGGKNHISNYQPLCQLCNTKKGNKIPCENIMQIS